MIWADLTGGEIRRRLEQRGVPHDRAVTLVRFREHGWAIREINRLLAH